MAEMTAGSMRAYREPMSAPAPEAGLGARLGMITQYAGAAVSVALLIGMTVWGYKLVMRDVSGLPVVRAAEGPMRAAPEDPGGNLALNTGLAVNAIAALGQAEEPESRLMLAPATSDLTEDDLLVAPTAEAGDADLLFADPETAESIAQDAAPQALSPTQPMTAEEILALADQIAVGAAPLTDLAPPATAVAEAAIAGAGGENAATVDTLLAGLATETARAVGVIDPSIPGVARALRPLTRPSSLVTVATATAPATAPAAAADVPQLAADIPAGATLVQLGAYETQEIAAAEWSRLAGRFAEFMGGKSPVVQEASSGGQTFFRLRALGFADFEDAGRFCAALVAEGALCIPVAGN